LISIQEIKNDPVIRLSALTPTSDYSGTVSVKVDFSFPDQFLDSITLETLRQAYKSSDRRFRVKYTIKLYKLMPIGAKKLREISFAKKWTLYWTRDPMILETYKAYIWVLGIDKDGYAVFFQDFDRAKRFLFSISETLTLAANELGIGTSTLNAKVEVKIWRHTFINATKFSVKSKPIKLSVIKD
jgi:hypothetical protein